MDKFSALIQTHTGGSVLLDVNQIVDQVAKEEQYAPEVVKLALEEIDRQRQVVVGVVPEFGFPKVAGRG
jgi:tetrahydromethanopterin S-methyltransferase subunit B